MSKFKTASFCDTVCKGDQCHSSATKINNNF